MTPAVLRVFGGLLVALLLASAVGAWLSRRRPSPAVDNLNARVRAWWVMIAVGGAALALGQYALLLLFGALAWFALREFVALGWYFAAVPLHFAALAFGWWWMAALAIPALCLAVPGRDARLGLLFCVYGLSAVPALASGERMLFLVLVVQASDVLQYLWGQALGRHRVAPRISPGKTVEGLAGGVLSATALGALLHGLSPFSPGRAALVSLAITLAGFASGLLFSALKRERGLKDWGTAITGHGGG